jgi:PAS domain S-box-containing protein
MNPDQFYELYQDLQSYVGWSDEDMTRVRSIAPIVTPYLDPLVDDFYMEIQRHPQTLKIITGGDEQIERLKGTLRGWLEELLAAQCDRAYVLRRWRIGWRHVEIGLAQVYTNAAMSRLRTGLMRIVSQSSGLEMEQLSLTVASLNKLLDLDLAIIEDAYQAALRESEERIRWILNTAADAIITVDRRGMINDFNPVTEKMFGYTRKELVGQNVSMLIPSPYREEHDEHLGRYLGTDQARVINVTRELTARRKNGSLFPIELSVSAVNHLDLFTDVIRDISERKALQKEVLDVATEEQRRIGQDLHDSIGQRLTGIGYAAQTLVEKLSTAPRRLEELDVVTLRDVATKLSDGIGTMFEELHAIVQGLVPVQLGARGLIDALDELARVTDALEDVTCAFKCKEPVDVLDTTTATHLYRIAQEAVGNALKHSRATAILIALEADTHGLLLQIADDGTGIDPAAEQSARMGLKIMRYRAGMIGATFAVDPVERGGTVVLCQLYGGGKV